MLVVIRFPNGRHTTEIQVQNATITRDPVSGLLRVTGQKKVWKFLGNYTRWDGWDGKLPPEWPHKDVERNTTWWERVIQKKGPKITESKAVKHWCSYEPFDRMYDSTVIEVIP